MNIPSGVKHGTLEIPRTQTTEISRPLRQSSIELRENSPVSSMFHWNGYEWLFVGNSSGTTKLFGEKPTGFLLDFPDQSRWKRCSSSRLDSTSVASELWELTKLVVSSPLKDMKVTWDDETPKIWGFPWSWGYPKMDGL